MIYDTEGLEGISTTEASAGLNMTTHALSVNLSYAAATANYDPVKLAGTVFGASIPMGLATVVLQKTSRQRLRAPKRGL